MIDRSSARRYEAELGAIDELLAEAPEDMPPALAAAFEGLQNRKEALQAKRDELGDRGMAAHDLYVILRGKPVVGQAIESEFLSDILRNLQDLMRSFVAALAGKKTASGPVPAKLKRISTLRFAGAFEGSFGMLLETADEQREMQLEGSAPVADAFATLIRLVESGDDPAALLDGLGSLGKRSRSHYQKLLHNVSKSKAALEVGWPSIEGLRTAEISPTRAGKAAKVLGRVKETTHYENREGVLTGGNLRLGTFEFVDEQAAEVLSGRLSTSLRGELELGHWYRAVIHVTELSFAGLEHPKRHYRLDEITPAEHSSA